MPTKLICAVNGGVDLHVAVAVNVVDHDADVVNVE